MLEKTIQALILPAAVALYACDTFPESNADAGTEVDCATIAPEGDHCAGNPLFCDDFNGPKLDLTRWNVAATNDELTVDGVLEIRTRDAAIFTSLPTFPLGNNTYVLEARWKVKEREGTDFDVGLSSGWTIRGSEGAVYFALGYGNLHLRCSNADLIKNETEKIECDANVENWITTSFILTENGVKYCTGGNEVAVSYKSPKRDKPFTIDFTCQNSSSIDSDVSCYIDHIRLIKKINL